MQYIECVYSEGGIMATSIRLDPVIEQRLDNLAAQTGRTKAYYLRELVANGLDDLEDYYLAAIDDGARAQGGRAHFHAG
jgi:predicted DNA-binding protein